MLQHTLTSKTNMILRKIMLTILKNPKENNSGEDDLKKKSKFFKMFKLFYLLWSNLPSSKSALKLKLHSKKPFFKEIKREIKGNSTSAMSHSSNKSKTSSLDLISTCLIPMMSSQKGSVRILHAKLLAKSS